MHLKTFLYRSFVLFGVITSLLFFGQFAHVASAKQINSPSLSSTDTCPSPPANFNPLTASKAELQYYGLPLPAPGINITQWANAVNHAKHRVCTSTSSSRYSLPGPTHSSSSSGTSQNWAGYVQTSQSFYEIQSYWVFNSFGAASDQEASNWVGLGGYGGGNLLQTGSNFGPYSDYATNCLWWEEYPKNTMQFVGIQCNNQDSIYGTVSYTNNTDSVYVQNVTTGFYFSKNVGTGFAPSHSAEWIDERPACSGSNYYQLFDFVDIYWYNGYTEYGNTYEAVGGIALTMVDYGSNPPKLAIPGSITYNSDGSNHYTDTWKASGTSHCG